MANEYPIHDLWIRPIAFDSDDSIDVWHVLGFDDHVLLRLGSLQVVRLPAGSQTPLRLHDSSDEVWALVEGQVRCYWWDLRTDSPTHDHTHSENLSQPTVMLAPFGVAFGIQAIDRPALLLRLMTSSEDEHQRAQTLAWPSGD